MVFVGCSPVKSTLSGLENVSYLELYSTASKYKQNVTVTVDDKAPFSVLVNKSTDSMKPKRYEIPVGKHIVHVYLNNAEVLSETIFTSSQITKKITLP